MLCCPVSGFCLNAQHRTAAALELRLPHLLFPSSAVWCISQTVPKKHCFSFLILLLNTSSFPQCQSRNNSLAPKGLITLKSARTSCRLMFYITQVIQHTIQLSVSELSKQAKDTLSGDCTFVSDFPRSYLFP